MKGKVEYHNPIHLLRLNTPDFVWDWYEEKFRAAVKEFSESDYNSFTITLNNYRDGRRSRNGLLRLHVHLKRIIEKVFPILNPDDFFTGDPDQMEKAAFVTVERMIEAYENEYNIQKQEAHVA